MIEFDWLIHYKCNYRCPYCFFEGMWSEVEQRNRYQPHETWLAAWERIHAKYGDMKVIITGGEPFIYPGFAELVAGLSGFAAVSFDTNLSVEKSALARFLEKADARRLFMGMSFHQSHGRLEEFLEKAKMVKDKGIDCRVHYVTYPPFIGGLPRHRDIFTSAGLRFTPIPFRGVYEGKVYPAAFTPQEQETIYGVTSTIAPSDRAWADRQVVQVRSRDKKCRAGQTYARIDADGNAYPCGHDFSKSREAYLLGNILDENFALRSEPMVCRQETCPCEFRFLVNDDGKK